MLTTSVHVLPMGTLYMACPTKQKQMIKQGNISSSILRTPFINSASGYSDTHSQLTRWVSTP